MRYEKLEFLLHNVLIDQNCNYLDQDEYRELVKGYEKRFVVGRDMRKSSYDDNCANYCIENNCDFLTTDRTAFEHFFKIRSIKTIQITRFHYEKPPSDRWVFCIEIVDGKKDDVSKGVKL